MSGITGIFHRDGFSVSIEEIDRMNCQLSHRGPDGSSLWCKDNVALGHLMLHTTLESIQEILPFEDVNDDLVITADARIDNRMELAPVLGLKNTSEVPDSKYILEAYKRWGENCSEKLLGDFAFAIWDRNNKKVFCARDHIGMKPFYYYLSDRTFAFASEIKALFALPEISHKINELKVGLHLLNVDDNKSTFYLDIHRLPAAHSISIDPYNCDLSRYWELDRESEIIMNSEEDYINEFLRIFTEAVRCRLRSAFPIGFELSGGLDSSSVACVGKHILNLKKDSVETFSILYKDFPDSDESYFINKVINTGEFNSHSLFADNISPMDNVKDILESEDEPFDIRTFSVIWKFNKLIHDNGVRIVLTGEDGDSVISKGQNYFYDLAISFNWMKLFKELKYTSDNIKNNRKFSKKSQSILVKTFLNRTFFDLLIQKVIIPIIPEFLKKVLRPVYNKKNKTGMLGDISILNKTFLKQSDLKKYLDEIRSDPAKSSKEFHFDIFRKRPHQLSLELIEGISAPFSIEKRHPFYDKRLIEFCYAIPTEMKYKFGWDRYILRKAMEDFLPEEVCWRFIKQDFNPPLQRNLLLFEKILLEKIVNDEDKLIEKYVDLDILQSSYDNYKSQGGGNGIPDSIIGVVDSINLWLVSILYVWLLKSNFKV
jgi:asparagine synthase (glutamine-hydrolysing)